MKKENTLRVAVVGGGISGLAAAHRLRELAEQKKKHLEIVLLEAGDHLGGVIRTEVLGRYLIEEGPDAFITTKPWALDLCRRIGLQDELIPTRAGSRRTYVVRRGSLVPVPDGFYMMAPTKLGPLLRSPLFSWRGKARMALDLVLPPRRNGDDESLASFVRRRLGREALERLVQPLTSGVYSTPPERLSLAAAMPQMLEMERRYGSLIRAVLAGPGGAAPAGGSGARYSLFVSFRRGMQTLTDALAARLNASIGRGKVDIRLGTGVVRIAESEHGLRLTTASGTLEADAAVVALGAPQAAKLLKPLDEKLSDQLGQIRYGGSGVAHFAFRRGQIAHSLGGFGFVVPRLEGLPFLACSFSSIKFEGRAPQGSVLLRCFLGEALQPQVWAMDDSHLLAALLRALRKLLGISGRPQFARLFRHPQAMPQYQVGHLSRVAQIKELSLRHPTILLAGNAYEGVGIPDCVRSGEQAAEQLLFRLTSVAASTE